MRRFFRNNGLSIVLFGLFFLSFAGQYLTGIAEYNSHRKAHGKAAVGYFEYLGEGHFIEATFENWESEFLQMGMFVLLTVFLFQKGSAQSREPGKIEESDIIPEKISLPEDAPAIVKRGGWQSKLYQYSLSLALFSLFALSFVLHAVGGAKEHNLEQIAHGEPPISTFEFIQTSQFWFQSFQNWQSEFLSIGVIVVLSIFLRQKGSPESKPVFSSHIETGTS